MADKLSARTITSTITGGYVHIIVPDGLGGWLSKRTAVTNFVTPPTALGYLFENVTGNISQAINANSYVPRIALRTISGAPVYRAGNTVNGTEYSGGDVAVGAYAECKPEAYFTAGGAIYITVSGGNVNIKIETNPNNL